MKEQLIGTILEVVEQDGCKGCVFENAICAAPSSVACCADIRSDNNYIIYKQVTHTKPTIKRSVLNNILATCEKIYADWFLHSTGYFGISIIEDTTESRTIDATPEQWEQIEKILADGR